MLNKKVALHDITYHVVHSETIHAATPLLLLHGFTGSSNNWLPLIPACESIAPVIAVDLPGHGHTSSPEDPSRYEMPMVSRDLIAILDALDVERAFLLGYSMGGRLALYTAVHHQDRFDALILESSSPGLRTQPERMQRVLSDKALADRIERDGIEAFVDYWEQIPLFSSQNRLSRSLRDQVRAGRLANKPIGLANSLRGMGTGTQPSLWERLPDLTVPVLLLTGEFDAKFRQIATEMQSLLPNRTHRVIANSGHAIHLEAAESYLDAVRTFFGDQDHRAAK